jgi:hypothetical protein
MLGVIARIVAARPTTPPNGSTTTFARDRPAFQIMRQLETLEGGGARRDEARTQITKFAV